jgi:ankyrin repeat protein
MLDFLNNNRFDWNIRNNAGQTPAILTAQGIGYSNYYDDLYLDLMVTTADWSLVDNKGKTPLMYAAIHDCIDIFFHILKMGTTLRGITNLKDYVNMRDINGKSAYDYVVQYIREDDPDGDPTQQHKQDMLSDLVEAGYEPIIMNNVGTKTIYNIRGKSPPATQLFMNNIVTGNNMIDFNNEFNYERYYKESEFNALPRPKKNPYTRKKITRAHRYKAKIVKRWPGRLKTDKA